MRPFHLYTGGYFAMGDYGKLASTGAGIAIGGVFINQLWLLAIAVGCMLVGALAIRLGWRRNKTMSDA